MAESVLLTVSMAAMNKVKDSEAMSSNFSDSSWLSRARSKSESQSS